MSNVFVQPGGVLPTLAARIADGTNPQRRIADNLTMLPQITGERKRVPEAGFRLQRQPDDLDTLGSMQTIHLTTHIAAPVMRVFLLSLSVDLHTASTQQTDERAIAGVTHGLMKLGDHVTWQGRHFGLMLTHTSAISRYLAPDLFEDTMTKGAFKSFRHVHSFRAEGAFTVMTDELVFCSPLGFLGAAIDRLVLCGYLKRFLEERNRMIRAVAESDHWQRFIPEPC